MIIMNLIRCILMIIYIKYCFEYIRNMDSESFFSPLEKFIVIVFMVMIWQFIYSFIQLIYKGLND